MDRRRLDGLAVFSGLEEQELDAVAAAATEREFAEGESLMSEGDLGHCLFVLESGTAQVSSNGSVVGTVGPGDVVGEIAVLASGRRTASVVATSPIRSLAWFKRDVWALEDKAPEAAARFRAAIEAHTQ